MAIRGLAFTRDVPVEFRNTEQLQQDLENHFLRVYGQKNITAVSLAYSQLGLFPRHADFKRTLTSVYGRYVHGMYDSRLKRVILLAPGPQSAFAKRPGTERKLVLLHELVHALQDQHFGLGERLGPSHDDDGVLALRAVAEGDAALTETLYRRKVAPWIQAEVGQPKWEPVEDAGAREGVPAAIMDKLMFESLAGGVLVNAVFEKKGWAGVNRLYAHPPLSTEQVLYPEKYLDEPDPPSSVHLKTLAALFSSDWRVVEDNSLGELMIRCLFKGFLPWDAVKKVARGWDGDRFVAFAREGQAAFIWVTVWDSLSDAHEFRQGYQGLLRQRGRDASEDLSRFHLTQRQRIVMLVGGLDPVHVTKNIESVWTGIAVEEKPFIRPFPL